MLLHSLANTNYVAEWLLSATKHLPDKHLPEKCVPIFERLVRRLLDFLSDNPNVAGTGALDWAMAANFSIAGKVVEALYCDPRCKDLVGRQGLPVEWRTLVENALALPGNSGRYALVFCNHKLNWFYHVDPEWTDEKLLSVRRRSDTKTLDAWWAGFYRGAHQTPSFELLQVLKPDFLEKSVELTYGERSDDEMLAACILECWRFSGSKTGAEGVSDKEFCEVLLKAGHHFRSRVLRQLERRSEGEGESAEIWKPLRERFLRQVWPIQKTARTLQDSTRLIEFAFSDEESFVAVSDAILQLIGRIERDLFITLPPIGKGGWSIVDKHPGRVLEILDRALPESANNWPYEIGAILERIVDADPSLRKDTRWIELSRRWNSR